ncbi:MAG: DUF362 domain-containing protein [Endomicrobium sp.]|jgi:uncharacterized protein (DUF362 family)|nr:DUF362 domain-containing protein [Endomicrobium sp.]
MKKLFIIFVLACFFCAGAEAQIKGKPIPIVSGAPLVGLAKGTNYAQVTADAIANAGGLNGIVKKGNTVLIKPNLCLPWFETPLAVDYRVVAEVVRQVKALGAGRIIIAEGAFDPDPFSAANQKVSKFGTITGVEFVDLNALTKDDCYYILPQNGVTGKAFYMPKMYVDADVVINVAKLKTHEDTIVSLGLKNVFGVPPKPMYSRPRAKLALHHEYGSTHNPIVDLNLIRLPDFTVVDGIMGGERSAPRTGKAVKSEIVIAGRNIASVDAVSAYLMGFNPKAIPHIRMAQEVGIGPIDLTKINVSNAKPLSKQEIDNMIVQFSSPYPKGW